MTQNQTTPSLILASSSPKRSELLKRFSIPFQIIPPDIDESALKNEHPKAYVTRVAKEKALSIPNTHPKAFILAADTIVAAGRRILRKAQCPLEACEQMRLLSGRTHRVYTALSMVTPDKRILSRIALTRVTFKRLSLEEIEWFVKSNEWKNVAVYRVSEVANCKSSCIASFFIKKLIGLETNIYGLPLYETYQLLKGAGLINN